MSGQENGMEFLNRYLEKKYKLAKSALLLVYVSSLSALYYRISPAPWAYLKPQCRHPIIDAIE
jgi:hypothetical protein